MDDNLPTRVKYWLTEAKHDCFFVVGPENGPTERLGSVKILLMGDSEPFRAMLQDSELAEKGDIRVTDVEPETFKTFLKCVYGGSSTIIPKLGFEEMAKLLYVTEKYLVNEVKAELTLRMTNIFSEKDIFVALSYPICHQVGSLKIKILDILKFDFNKITLEEMFVDLSDIAIAFILKTNSIMVKETEIWTAVLRWAKHKTGSDEGKVLRLYMFNILKHFRFLAMDYTEFWEIVVPTEILHEDEVFNICKSFVTGEPCSIEHLSNNKHTRYNKRIVSKNVVTSLMETPKYAFIRCSVTSVSEIQSGYHHSKSYQWAGHFWNVAIEKHLSGTKESLGLYVECSGKTRYWSCAVDVEINLINQTGKGDEKRDYTKIFSSSGGDSWGWSQFYDWSTLIDPNKGFIKNNTIILLAKIQVKQ